MRRVNLAPWLWLSVGAGLLSIAGSIVGLLANDRIYDMETSALADAATAQDLVGLVVLGPLLLTLAAGSAAGSLTARLCLLGCVSFSAYNYAIYAFSVHFGPLFPVWVAVLGLSLFGLIAGLAALDAAELRSAFSSVRVRVPGWSLIALATLFGLLWLSQVLGDLLAGRPSSSALEWDAPTNPVHVLDLAFFLPAVCVSGASLLRRRPLGYATTVGQLVFLELTCLPALVTPLVANARGHTPGWPVMVPLGVIAVVVLVAMWRMLPLRAASADASS